MHESGTVRVFSPPTVARQLGRLSSGRFVFLNTTIRSPGVSKECVKKIFSARGSQRRNLLIRVGTRMNKNILVFNSMWPKFMTSVLWLTNEEEMWQEMNFFLLSAIGAICANFQEEDLIKFSTNPGRYIDYLDDEEVMKMYGRVSSGHEYLDPWILENNRIPPERLARTKTRSRSPPRRSGRSGTPPRRSGRSGTPPKRSRNSPGRRKSPEAGPSRKFSQPKEEPKSDAKKKTPPPPASKPKISIVEAPKVSMAGAPKGTTPVPKDPTPTPSNKEKTPAPRAISPEISKKTAPSATKICSSS